MILSIAVYRKLSYGYLLLPFLAISLTVATLFNQFVELPSIRLGRRIGRIRVGNNSIEASPQVTPE
jgi:peptidoglycan/LPS O-acetylase OafA/YrhL